MNNVPELLAPAGNKDCLIAAIENGADAVYFGLDSFNARMRAGNFTRESVGEALSLCNAYGVKTYVTLNTRLFDDELFSALKMAEDVWQKGASGLIVADMGLATELKRQIPEIEIHASTQLSGHSVGDAVALKDAGFSRMVCHREITKDNLAYLCQNSPIEIEMFVHGAHCVSFSGQCLMSAMMGGRSGNRGECAQPCRQCYTKDGAKSYPLSLKDMCLASHLTEICSFGVASLKIEGRQKPHEYVGGVTRIYRRLLDESRNATDSEIKELFDLFNREGFTDGYYNDNHRSMTGIRLPSERGNDAKKENCLTKKVEVSAILVAKRGEKPALTYTSDTKSATAMGEIANGDITPLTKEGAEKNVSRLGSTPFVLTDFTFDTDGDCPLPLSAVNALRRDAVEKLLNCEREKHEIEYVRQPASKKAGALEYTAEFLTEDQVTPLAREFFSKIYIQSESDNYGVSLSPYQPDKSGDCNGEYYLVHSASELKKYGGALSLRGNVFNSAAASYYASLGAEYITVAPEVRLAKVRDIVSPVPLAVVVYGRLPLMLCVRCLISDGKKNCKGKHGELCYSSITDRYRVSFPVVGLNDCTNVIYNSVPIYMADKMDDVKRCGASIGHFIFTTESADEVDDIILSYKNGTPYKTNEIRRLTF